MSAPLEVAQDRAEVRAVGLWRLRPTLRDETPMVELEPCSGPELARQLRGFITAVR